MHACRIGDVDMQGGGADLIVALALQNCSCACRDGVSLDQLGSSVVCDTRNMSRFWGEKVTLKQSATMVVLRAP